MAVTNFGDLQPGSSFLYPAEPKEDETIIEYSKLNGLVHIDYIRAQIGDSDDTPELKEKIGFVNAVSENGDLILIGNDEEVILDEDLPTGDD